MISPRIMAKGLVYLTIIMLGAAQPWKSAAAADFYVNNANPRANDAGPGSREVPCKTISGAVQKAGPGDTVWIAAGTYRETVTLSRGGRDPQHPLRLRALAGAAVQIKGSDLVSHWQPHAGAIWKLPGWRVNSQQVFVDGKPLQQIGAGSPFHTQKYEGKPRLAQVGRGLTDMAPGSFFFDPVGRTLYVWLPDGSNPSQHEVEASVRDFVIPPGPADPQYGFIELHDLRFAHSNHTARGLNMGVVNISGRDWVVTGCHFDHGDFAGLAVTGEGHKISNNVANHNGDLGINLNGSDAAHGWKRYPDRPPQRLVFSGNETSFNNYRRFLRNWHCGGFRATTSCNGVTVTQHKATGNLAPGIWFDGWCRNIVVNRCTLLNNDGPGIFYEISDDAVIANNLAAGNKQHGIYVASSDGVAVINNTLDKNWVGIGLHGMPRPDHPSLRNNRVRNNIIGESQLAELVVYTNPVNAGGNTSDYNLYFRPDHTVRIAWTGTTSYSVNYRGLKEFSAATGQETHSLSGDPLWVNAAAGDYELKAGSPAIGAGEAPREKIGDRDLAGRPRSLGGRVDLGAYEFQGR